MKTELESIHRQLETLEAFARRYPMSAALAERTHPGSIYHRDQTPDVGIVIARGWTGENAERVLAEAGELFGRDGWIRLRHAGDSLDFHWHKEVSGVRLSLLYTETAGDMPNPDGAHGSPVPPECFPTLQPASPAATAPATTGANHSEAALATGSIVLREYLEAGGILSFLVTLDGEQPDETAHVFTVPHLDGCGIIDNAGVSWCDAEPERVLAHLRGEEDEYPRCSIDAIALPEVTA